MIKVVRIVAMMIATLGVVAAVEAQTPAQPTIGGSVFGGGRMADVDGKTQVTVVNCNTISAVYGGNDIAGEVKGTDGAIVTIGTSSTTQDITIGSVYGGGNGYYSYSDDNGYLVHDTTISGASAKTRNYVTTSAMPANSRIADYAFPTSGDTTVVVANAAGLYVPQVKKTTIVIEQTKKDFVKIDSLFGGARNAFVTNTSGSSTSVTINGGTIYAAFGGNNVGGSLGAGSTHTISVTGTKTGSTSANLGEDMGIRYLFGGGNKVQGRNVSMTISGGQIDTCFGGGNSADVDATSVLVNVTTPLYDFEHSPYYTTPVAYHPVNSVFDIRCLFGGNNAADMNGMPTLNLTKGGVHTVYGGGNKGVMLAAESYTDNYNRENLTPEDATWNKANAKRSTNVTLTSANFLCDTVYGGGQSAGTLHDTYVEVSSNGRAGVVYGGTNISGRIGPDSYTTPVARNLAKTNVYIGGGIVYNTVFGGSNGFYRCSNDGVTYNGSEGNILFPSPDPYTGLKNELTPAVYKCYVYMNAGQVMGAVYSSGNMAAVGKPQALTGTAGEAGISILHVVGGTIGDGNTATGAVTRKASVFGGGNMGCVYGGADLHIGGTAVVFGDVYGGNDKTGRIFSTLRGVSGVTELATASTAAPTGVDINTTDFPGMPANITGGTTITLNDQNASAYALIDGTSHVWGTVYGGGNGDYDYTYSSMDALLAAHGGDDLSGYVVSCSGTPDADQRSSFVDINVADGGYIDRVFGGGNSKTTGYATRNSGSTIEQGDVTVYMNCAGNNPADDASDVKVGTIFGGNNNVAMNKVPRVILLKGKVGKVYGGGNQGNMTGLESLDNLPVSTYVVLPSNLVVVAQNIYGGCNVADVTNDTYVKLDKGTVRGEVFGGNDRSGEVKKSHVLVAGTTTLTLHGNIFGGGDGNYAFYEESGTSPLTYYIKENDVVTYTGLKGRPYVDSTDVVLNGTFTVDGNVYGGGVSGDCRKTRVLVDAPNGTFNGMIFGAGRGRVDNMGLRIGPGVNGIGDCKHLYIGVATSVAANGTVTYGDGNAMGNVLDTAWLTVRQFGSMSGSRSAMFGGGQSGNVNNTMVTYEPTATARLDALYLGCLASDVTGTAIGVINAYEPANGRWIIDTLYGGNDFTGRVANTDMTINSGIFTHFFGAGNGEYSYIDSINAWKAPGGRLNDDAAILERTTCNCVDTVPYSMNVVITVNGGTFLNTVYGGGNMGLVGDRDMVPTDMEGDDAGRGDHIGNITLNVHDGLFERHIFTGARGKTGMTSRFFQATGWTNPVNGTTVGAGKNVDNMGLGNQLAYAFKVFNMDGGTVLFSVYGGSEAVDDGYPFECVGPEQTNFYRTLTDRVVYTSSNRYSTMRPSSVLNIMGGDVKKSVYGGGYQGNIYGSVYVNIGRDAIDDSPVWTDTYGTDGSATVSYASHKPSNLAMGNALYLETSVYNGSDWGEAGDNAYFNTRGVFGGETNMLIDGQGYNTSLTNSAMLGRPVMNIAYSLVGSGTSTEGGDLNRLITLRHYGEYTCPTTTRNLYSIQRADKVILDSVFITLLGEQDAFMAYVSPNYTFCRIDTLLFRVDNVVFIEEPSIYIGNLTSMKSRTEDYAINGVNFIYTNDHDDALAAGNISNDLLDNLTNGLSGTQTCDDNPRNCEDLDFCAKLPTQRGSSDLPGNYNALVMKNGSYMKVSPFIDESPIVAGVPTRDGKDDVHAYGHVYGFMYLLAQDNTMSYVYADYKSNSVNRNDGGFVAPCDCDNQQTGFTNEIAYRTVDVESPDYDYRTWKVGRTQGDRTRHITLVANANPDNILNYNLPAGTYGATLPGETAASGHTFVVSNSMNFGYATATLELPPSQGGNFYLISSVLIDQDNGEQLQLTDQGYDKASNTFFFAGTTPDDTLKTLHSIYLGNESVKNYTFGLTFSSLNAQSNFSSTRCASTTLAGVTDPSPRDLINTTTQAPYACWPISAISGSQYMTDVGGYISNSVDGAVEGVIPTMQFTLTYDKDITTTLTRDVVFTMYEYTATGEYLGPVKVTVTISTVIKQFSDLEAPVMAMYNEGISDKYVRKVTIPASFLQRDIYLEGIEWVRDPAVAALPGNLGDHFYLQDVNTPINDNIHFSLIVNPTESSSENVNNHLGWYNINDRSRNLDVYATALDDYRATTGDNSYTFTTEQQRIYNSWDYDETTTGDQPTNMKTEGKGILIGTLDGRSTASVDVTLNFDGDRVYYDHFEPDALHPGPLAYVDLKMHWYNTKLITNDGTDNGTFIIRIKLRTREHGDTIYMAPGNTLVRYTTEGTRLEMRNWSTRAQAEGRTPTFTSEKSNVPNDPDCYVNTFKEAMDIYREGDVIDIMETITINNENHSSTVRGDDYSVIQIIRYSGSHYKFPSMGCAHRGVMIDVSGAGKFGMRNVLLNGSGCTRTKVYTTSEVSTGGEVTLTGGHYYYENYKRDTVLLYSEAPMLFVHGGGYVNMSNNVRLINNFNQAKNAIYNSSTGSWDANDNFIGGGAICLRKDGTSTPSILLGENSNLYDNIVRDWTDTNGSVFPLNYGGAVYVDGGKMMIGNHTATNNSKISIEHNYYLKASAGNTGITPKFKYEISGDTTSFVIFHLDTVNMAQHYSLSNVYLKRTAGTCPDEVRRDERSDRVYFLNEMTEDSRVGISKWFPGYVYDGGTSHRLNNDIPRDTIGVAMLDGSTTARIVDDVFDSLVFFNDSIYYSVNNITTLDGDPANRSFVAHPLANTALTNRVTYYSNTTDNPNYGDDVYMFHHTLVQPFTIYFQRCASFGKGVKTMSESACTGTGVELRFNNYGKSDSISFHYNSTATCVSSTDTIFFNVGGGFFPYTYHWDYDSVVYEKSGSDPMALYRKPVRDRTTLGTNSISSSSANYYSLLRDAAECDTLVLSSLQMYPSLQRSTYLYEVTATDLTGNCQVSQAVAVRVGKFTQQTGENADNFFADTANFLRHRASGTDSYRVQAPGVDSSSFHDHVGRVPEHDPGNTAYEHDYRGGIVRSATPNADASDHLHEVKYVVYENGSWIDDPDRTGTTDMYASNLTPRYLRVYRSYKIEPIIYPSDARGEVHVYAQDATVYNSSTEIDLATSDFCPGDILQLRPEPAAATPGWEYMAWSFDPSTGMNTNFVVELDNDGNGLNKPEVFFSRGDYWWEVVNTYNGQMTSASSNPNVATRYDYDVDYYGNVTIRTNKGLAWLISTVNGYNGQNANTFHFNTITFDFDGGSVDMQAHKWTPLGNRNNPFEGTIVCVTPDPSASVTRQTINSIVVNENTLPLVGMFGYTRNAVIDSFALNTIIMKGNSYIGGLVAESDSGTVISDVNLPRGTIFGEYVIGGLVAKANYTTIDGTVLGTLASRGEETNTLRIKGNAIYAGGIVGKAVNSSITNNSVKLDVGNLSAIYLGGIVGDSLNVTMSGNTKGKSVNRTQINNNYVSIMARNGLQRVGGLVGRAVSMDLNNNYVYGVAKGTDYIGGLAGYVGSNVNISNCYYLSGMAGTGVGYNSYVNNVTKSTTFSGSGNQVMLTERVDGYSNMTRALNAWVNASGDTNYFHWRSDLENENNGYPIFGTPDIITVNDSMTVTTCDNFLFDGELYTESGIYVFHVVDSADYLDSTMTLLLTVNYSDIMPVSDTITIGEDYEGYGFHLSADEIREAIGESGSGFDIRTLQRVDSLLNANGCDSTIVLTLYILGTGSTPGEVHQLSDVKVYPNPTRSIVNVEGSDMERIEVYDVTSRLLFSVNAEGDKVTFDLTNHSSGSYYIRVRTAHGVVVKKVIKK